MGKPPRPRYPRIACSVPGCRRGTTIYQPGTRMICGPCWRRSPQSLRRWYSYWRRKAGTLEKRMDPRSSDCAVRANQKWEQILAVLSGEDESGGEIPALMAEELRKVAL